jgi:ABC-type multidrug transport system ATPase subunit
MDIYLLDDPLSAVDAKVAQAIFKDYIVEALKGKTVLLVSHGMQFLEKCERVIFLSEGRIAESGSHAELVAKEDGKYLDMLSFDQSQMKKEEEDDVEGELEKLRQVARHESVISKGEGDMEDPGLFTNQETDPENAGWSVLLKYFQVGRMHLLIQTRVQPFASS